MIIVLIVYYLIYCMSLYLTAPLSDAKLSKGKRGVVAIHSYCCFNALITVYLMNGSYPKNLYVKPVFVLLLYILCY